MTERPILFSAPMVRSILGGKKTQTRRLMSPKTVAWLGSSAGGLDSAEEHCPFGIVGDRLWVKETWARRLDEDAIKPTDLKGDWAWYWADPQTANTGCAGAAGKRRPSIFMQRRFSRITLEISDVRVQRLNEISEDDAMAEGIVSVPIPADEDGPSRIGYTLFPDDGKSLLQVSPRDTFSKLWDTINGDRASWSSNPWVWVVSFARVPKDSGK